MSIRLQLLSTWAAIALMGCSDAPGITSLQPKGSFQPATLPFGAVPMGHAKTEIATLQNTGPIAFRIDRVTPSARFEPEIPLLGRELLAGGSLKIPIRFEPGALGQTEGELVIGTGALDIAVRLTGEGVAPGVPSLTVEPAMLTFGSLAVGQTQSMTIRIVNEGGGLATLSRLKLASTGAAPDASSPFSTAEAPPWEVRRNDAVELTVVFSPMNVGDSVDTLVFEPDDPALRELRLPVRGTGLDVDPGFRCAPLELHFGEVTRGASATLNATCEATERAVDISNITVLRGRELFSTQIDGQHRIPAGDSLQIPVQFEAFGPAAPYQATLRVQYTVDGGRRRGADVALIGVVAIPPPTETDLTAILQWPRDQSRDMDLHLVRPGSYFDSSHGDCHWRNPAPDWGEILETNDNPHLDRDDEGIGGSQKPETVNLQNPEAGVYEVYVHFFNDRGSGTTPADVAIWLAGQQIETLTQPVDCNDVWHVGTYDFTVDPPTFAPSGTITSVASGHCN